MIGNMIAKVRKEKGMTKTELARLTDINIGHLTHIEKGERNPSHKALKNICKALNIPYQQLMYTYDKSLNEDQVAYGIINHITYNKVPAVDNINSFIDCPKGISSASFAVKVNDTSMQPAINKDDYVFVELNTVTDNKEIGIFCLNGKIFIRKFTSKNGDITLKASNKDFEDIAIKEEDSFYIIGKVLHK